MRSFMGFEYFFELEKIPVRPPEMGQEECTSGTVMERHTPP